MDCFSVAGNLGVETKGHHFYIKKKSLIQKMFTNHQKGKVIEKVMIKFDLSFFFFACFWLSNFAIKFTLYNCMLLSLKKALFVVLFHLCLKFYFFSF